MIPRSILLLVFAFMLTTLVARSDQLVPVGTNSQGTVTVPDAFWADNDDDKTVFIMPRKDDIDGPISIRITCVRDVKELKLDKKGLRELLSGQGPKENLKDLGDRMQISSEREFKDDAEIQWHLRQFAVVAEDLVFAITVGAIKGREKEPQNKELLEALPKIIKSLARKAKKIGAEQPATAPQSKPEGSQNPKSELERRSQ